MDHQAHILVVDDEKAFRHLLKTLLTTEGYRVSTADSGNVAIELLQQHTFNLVISDLMMGDVSGIDIMTHAKQLAPETEFIVITAFGSLETAVEALRQGAHDYIAKPFNNHQLLHSVKRVLAFQQTRQEKEQLFNTLQQRNQKLTDMLNASNRLAHLSPLPDLVLNEIIEIARRHLNLTVAVTVLDDEATKLRTACPDNLADLWWAQNLEQHYFSETDLKRVFTGAKRISQSFLIDLTSPKLPYPFNPGNSQSDQANDPDTITSLLAIPLDTRGTRMVGVLWVTNHPRRLSAEFVQQLEIFANQTAGTLDSARQFARQLNQLRVRNTLVNAGQRIATVLDHSEVAHTVLDAALKVIPWAEMAILWYRQHIDGNMSAVGLTSSGDTTHANPIDPELISQVLTSKQTVYRPRWHSGKSLIIEPLTLSSVSIGALAIISDRPNAFNEDLHQILAMLSNQAAIAMQNASLYAEAQRVDEIEALYEAGKAIDRTLNLQETLTTTMAVSRSLTGAAISNVYLYTPQSGRIDSVVTLSDELALTDADRRQAAAIARTVLETNQPSLVVERDSKIRAVAPNNMPPKIIQSWLAVPLPSNDIPMGVLQLGNDRPDAFNANDVRLIQIIGSHAATAIEKSRLYEEVQHRLQQTEALNAISQSISTTLELERVLELVVQSAAKTISVATHSALYLFDNTDELPEPEAQIATQTPDLPPELLDARRQAVQQATTQKETVRVTCDTAQAGPWSLLVAPLRVKQSIIGAISVSSPRPNAFHTNDETLLNTFASHASIAIQNANLFRDLTTAYTDLSQKQEEILRNHSTLQALFNGITDGLYITDRQLKIIAINQAEARRLGATPADFVGRTGDEHLWGPSASSVVRLVQNTFKTGQENTWESQTDVEQRGIFTDRDIHTYPIFTPAGNVTQVIIFAQDVSEQRRLQASLFRSANMAAVGQLASSVAHQINNPLTVIIGNSQIMEMETNPDSPEYVMVRDIVEAGTHIRKIVQNLLDFSTQDSYEWDETDVAETIADALMLVTHSLRKSHIRVEKEIALLPTIIASASHLKLLWMNLLLNARDAIATTEQEDGVVKITATQLDDNHVQIKIIDNGEGIPEQHQGLLFHPFFTTKSSGKNLGLGLFTCGAIVEFHQGTITLGNRTGGEPGAVVTITLPINPETGR